MDNVTFVIEVAIEPKATTDRDALAAALSRLAADDPFFGFSIDDDREQIILKGVSEFQLDAAISFIKHDIDILVGMPQVAYRETLIKRVEISYTHRRLREGIGQFAKVTIVFEPAGVGKGSSFTSKISGDAVPTKYICSTHNGVISAMSPGVIAGFPVVDVKATLIDAAYHENDSSEVAFEIAARSACREALQKGGALLEPIMKVEVTAPEEHAGFVLGDLRSRRASILGQVREGEQIVTNAMVPLANMFGYVNTLHSGTRGSGKFTIQYSHYAPMPSPDDDGPFRPAVGMRA